MSGQSFSYSSDRLEIGPVPIDVAIKYNGMSVNESLEEY